VGRVPNKEFSLSDISALIHAERKRMGSLSYWLGGAKTAWFNGKTSGNGRGTKLGEKMKRERGSWCEKAWSATKEGKVMSP